LHVFHTAYGFCPPNPILTSCIAVLQFAKLCKNGQGLLRSLFVDTLIGENWELAYMLHWRTQQSVWHTHTDETNCRKKLGAVRLAAGLLSQRPVFKARSFAAEFLGPKVAL